jgi:hypothetical protein
MPKLTIGAWLFVLSLFAGLAGCAWAMYELIA